MTGIVSMGGFEYKAPDSLEEALRILGENETGTMVMAGGTDLLVQMKYGQLRPALVIDVKQVPELNILEWHELEGLRIGAAVPLGRILSFPQLREKYGILAEAGSFIGSMQIKNRATIGGNICNAAPSADSVPALLCLEARCLLAKSHETRTVPLEELFLGPGKTAIRSDELLVSIEVPPPPSRAAGCYLRHTTREEMDIAVAGVGAYLVFSEKGSEVREARIALGAAAPTPRRARMAEACLAGKTLTPDIIASAAATAAEEAEPISDIRGSAEYRREIVRVLTQRTIKSCCETLDVAI